MAYKTIQLNIFISLFTIAYLKIVWLQVVWQHVTLFKVFCNYANLLTAGRVYFSQNMLEAHGHVR